MARNSVAARMDAVVNDFAKRCRFFHEPMTRGRAHMFAMVYRLNTRQRNSVLKLKVATNCALLGGLGRIARNPPRSQPYRC